MHDSAKAKGATALVGAAFTYACFGLLIRAMEPMFGNNAQVAFRFVLGFVILAVFCLVLKKSLILPRAAFLKAAALGLTFGALVTLFTISVMHTTLANSVFLTYAGSILMSLVIGTFILKEKLTSLKLVAIALSLLGLAMYSGALLALSIGVVTALLCGILDGVANGIRKTLKGYDRNTVLLYSLGFGALFASVMTAFSPEPAIKTISLMPLTAGIIFAFLQISLGNLLLYGFQHFDVNVGTVILATELFFATIIGLVFFHEVPATNELIGGLIIFSASILSAIDIKALWRRTRNYPKITTS